MKKPTLTILLFLFFFFLSSKSVDSACNCWWKYRAGALNCWSCQSSGCLGWGGVPSPEQCCCASAPSPICPGDECPDCFSAETQIKTERGEEKIQALKEGEEVISFNLEDNQETTSLVEKIYEVTRSAYYKIKTKDGKELKVTGEHPLYAIQKEKVFLTFWEYLKTESLTKKFINCFLN